MTQDIEKSWTGTPAKAGKAHYFTIPSHLIDGGIIDRNTIYQVTVRPIGTVNGKKADEEAHSPE